MIETILMAAPAKRERKARLTAELKGLPVDKEKAVRLENAVANALRQYGRYQGWTVVGCKDGPDHQMLWRTA